MKTAVVLLASLGFTLRALAGDESDPVSALSRMSLEELANVEVTSVSKSAQSLSAAASAARWDNASEPRAPPRKARR